MKRKTITRKLLAVAAFAGLVCAVDVGTVYAEAFTDAALATIVKPLTIGKTTSLSFGGVIPGVPGAGAGTVKIDTTGDRTKTGSVTFATGSFAGTVSAAEFAIDGEAATYTISLDDTVTLTSGVNSMTLDTLVSNPSGTGTLPTDGTLLVGGTLHVLENQAPGAYKGILNVTIAYQ